MSMIVGVLVLLMCLAGSVSGLNKDTKNYILNAHNTYRKREGASNMAKLVWDTTLESEAAAWASRCRFEHQNKGRGENLAWNSNVALNEQGLIDHSMKSFYDEKSKYSYGQRSCSTSGACHYTQVVWAKTRRVGCASRVCKPLANAYSQAWFLVCFYDPRGNWNGEKPYEKGAACSGCGIGATCSEGLCVGGRR